jgi:hypothetical protein
MASAAAISRPRSTWDILADAFGNSAARFDGLTGARIGAHGVNGRVMPWLHGAVRVAQAVGNTRERAAHWMQGAVKHGAYLATHPRAVVGAIDAALRGRGHGRQLDNFYKAAGNAYYHGRRDYRFDRNLYGQYKRINSEPYPAHEHGMLGALDRGLSNLHDWYGHVKRAAWGLKGASFMRWVPFGGGMTRFLAKHFSPIDIAWNAAATARDLWHKDWGKAAWHAGMTGAYAVSRNFAREGLSHRLWTGAVDLFKNRIPASFGVARKFVTRRAVPWVTDTALPAARTFVTDKALPWITEKVLPWVVRGGLEAGLWGWGAAALAGAALAGYEIYKHPKETKAFLHNTGDFFRNVAAGVRGDPRARQGWHPWADFAASSLRTGGDLLSLNAAGAMRDARAQGHAFNKILGFERQPGAKGPPMTLSKLGAKAFKFLWDDVIPQVDGGAAHGAVKALANSWSWLRKPAQASRPHAPAPPARITGHVQAPAVRITQPRRPRAANLPTKTEAEIRVQFNNAPPGARAAARTDAAAFQFETGAQFAF